MNVLATLSNGSVPLSRFKTWPPTLLGIMGCAIFCVNIKCTLDPTCLVPPTANAGADRATLVGSMVELNGSASTHPSGDPLTYSWQQTEGPTVVLSNSGNSLSSFVATEEGQYAFSLTVDDGCSIPDQAVVRVWVGRDLPPEFPRANAGADALANENSQYCLDGTASADPNGSGLQFEWIQIAGEPVTLRDPFTEMACFDGLEVSGDQELQFQLTVTNEQNRINSDSVIITVQDHDCGADCCVSDADCTDGAEGTEATCRSGRCHYVPSGPTCPAEGCPTGTTCDVMTGKCVATNSAPTANAGPDQVKTSGELVTLDGTASSDFDNDVLTYSWLVVSETTIMLDDSSSAMPSFLAPEIDAELQLQFSLTVNDGSMQSTPDVVTITINPAQVCVLPLSLTSETFPSGGKNPIGIAIFDMNLDGVHDVIVGNSADSFNTQEQATGVAVLDGLGNGRLDPPRTYFTGFGANRVAVGDIDHDGFQDVAVSNAYDSTIGILFGTDSGIFDATRSTQIAVGGSPRGIALAKLNGDDWLDIIVANAPTNKISIIFGTGNGGFEAPRAIDAGQSPNGPDELTLADFNNDGCLDLVTTLSGWNSNALSLFLGYCDGTLSPRITLESGNNPHGIATGDFDDNGDIDIVVGNEYGRSVIVLFGDGMGGFPTSNEIGTGSAMADVAVADFDRDGIDDFVSTAWDSESVLIFLSNGNGTFDASEFNTGASPNRAAVGDLDGDGDQDIAITNTVQSGAVTVMLNRCNP